MARPKIKKAERRSEQVNFRMTLTDKLDLLKFAQEDGKQGFALAREIIEDYLKERRENRGARQDQAKTRLPDEIYKAMERIGKHVNGITKVYHSQPKRPPHPQKLAGMTDDLEELIEQILKAWSPELKHEIKLHKGIGRIAANLGQMQDNYNREGLRIPAKLEQVSDGINDIKAKVGKLL